MVDFFVSSSIIMIWVVLIGAPVVLTVLRLVQAISSKLSWKKVLLVVLVPMSIYYYLAFPQRSRMKTAYVAVLLVFVFLSVYASVFIFYTHFA